MVMYYESTRNVVRRFLPEWMLRRLKKHHYVRVLKSRAAHNWEPDMKMLPYLINSGDLVVDIGANFGVYTKMLSELVNRHGEVYSIEPVPQTFDILCSAIERLSLDNVRPLNVAISDHQYVATIQVPHWDSGGENYYMAHIISDRDQVAGLRQVNVKAVTLDSLFASKKDKVSFIKCDVEGHELACIRGAARLLEESQPAWLMEVSGNPDDQGSPSGELFSILSCRGYKPWLLDGKGIRKRCIGDKSTNYFFLTERHVDKIRKLNSTLLV